MTTRNTQGEEEFFRRDTLSQAPYKSSPQAYRPHHFYQQSRHDGGHQLTHQNQAEFVWPQWPPNHQYQTHQNQAELVWPQWPQTYQDQTHEIQMQTVWSQWPETYQNQTDKIQMQPVRSQWPETYQNQTDKIQMQPVRSQWPEPKTHKNEDSHIKAKPLCSHGPQPHRNRPQSDVTHRNQSNRDQPRWRPYHRYQPPWHRPRYDADRQRQPSDTGNTRRRNAGRGFQRGSLSRAMVNTTSRPRHETRREWKHERGDPGRGTKSTCSNSSSRTSLSSQGSSDTNRPRLKSHVVAHQSSRLIEKQPVGSRTAAATQSRKNRRTEHRTSPKSDRHYRASKMVAHPSASLNARVRRDPKTCVDLRAMINRRKANRTLNHLVLRKKLQSRKQPQQRPLEEEAGQCQSGRSPTGRLFV